MMKRQDRRQRGESRVLQVTEPGRQFKQGQRVPGMGFTSPVMGVAPRGFFHLPPAPAKQRAHVRQRQNRAQN
jgi:hypothetical protein